MALPSYNSSVITAASHIQQGLSAPAFIIGGKGGSGGTTYKLFKKDTSYTFALFATQLFIINEAFNFVAMKFTLTTPVATNITITPELVFDNGSRTVTGTVINSTNYPNNERLIIIGPDNFSFNVHGEKNFYVRLSFSGSALVGVKLPIEIELNTEKTL